jgi:acyl-CoA synthetase (AMP-forming)/AMP-acid ligase II
MSYATLWDRACSIAGFLQREGLRKEDRVALVLENSPEYVATYYGTLLAGGIVVALNPNAKRRDLAAWLRHSEPAWLFTHSASTEVAAALRGVDRAPRTVHIGSNAPEGHETVLSFEAVLSARLSPVYVYPKGPADPASILYTSGTTGQPKGVLLNHGNLFANTTAIVSYLGLRSDDSIVCVLPFFYSYGNSVLHTHLAVGACVSVEDNLVYPHKVVERMAQEHATGFSGVPSTFELILRRVNLDSYDLSSLRYLTQAGGPMSVALTQRLRTALPQCRLFVMYGQTEATARLTYLPPDRLDEKLGSVGIPIQGVEIVVRRDDGASAGPGERGDVWVRGPNVMVGYWRDEQATAAAIQNRWLRTGDSGYLDDGGFLYLAGRRADIIKTGAYRVFPKEVEDVVTEVAGVAEAAVVGVEDEVLGQAIAAFVVPMADESLDVMRLRAYMREHLANYKVPKYVQIVGALPKTTSGKVIRNRLSEGFRP